MVVQVGEEVWVNPVDVVRVGVDANGFAVISLRGLGYGVVSVSTDWPVEVVVKSINAGGE